MKAAPITKFQLNDINCFEENHQKKPIIGICNDKKCNIENKLMCSECLFEIHNGHIGIKLTEIENIINTLKENDNENENFIEIFRNKIDEFKNKINQYIEEFYSNFIKKFNENFNINKENLIDNILLNYPPKNKEQLLNLQTDFINLFKNKEKDKKKEKIINIYNKYDNILINLLNNIENKIKKLLKETIFLEQNFEWSTKTYSNYEFYYNLEENNSKITKIKNNGTITICTGLKNLEKGNIYKLVFFINYKDGDYDIGFGDDTIGSNCTLRKRKSYCVSNYGIYVNGINEDNQNYLFHYKKIIFIIDLINFSFKILFDDNKIFNFNIINPQLIYYPMAAIKNLDNSVKLKVYKLLNL